MKLLSLLLLPLVLIKTQEISNLLSAFSSNSTLLDVQQQNWTGPYEKIFEQCEGTIAVIDVTDHIETTIHELPTHNQLRLQSTIFCSENLNVPSDPDMVISIDDVTVKTLYSQSFSDIGFRNCSHGSNYLFQHAFERFDIDLKVPHNASTYNLKFDMTDTQDILCLIADLELTPQNKTTSIEECADTLEDIKDSNGDYRIDNECYPYVENNEQRFLFNIWFENPYYFQDDCFDLQVNYQNTTLPQGYSNTIDQWRYISPNQTVAFDIKLEDFDSYNCTFGETPESYFWTCDFDLQILYQGNVQVQYKAKIMVTINRQQTSWVNTIISANQVEGECCENELNIGTELNICTTPDCSSFHTSGPVTIPRNEPFFVEHKITTQEFQHYYLKNLAVELGPLVPEILSFDSSNPGKVILQLRSSISLQNLVLKVISQLHNNPVSPATGRRFLSPNALKKLTDNQYNVAAVQQLTIEGENDLQQFNEKQSQQEEEQHIILKKQQQQKSFMSKNLSIIILIACSILLIASIVGITAKFYLNKKAQKQQKKQEQYAESEPEVFRGRANTETPINVQ